MPAARVGLKRSLSSSAANSAVNAGLVGTISAARLASTSARPGHEQDVVDRDAEQAEAEDQHRLARRRTRQPVLAQPQHDQQDDRRGPEAQEHRGEQPHALQHDVHRREYAAPEHGHQHELRHQHFLRCMLASPHGNRGRTRRARSAARSSPTACTACAAGTSRVIVNTGDDYEHLGLAFSPDLDTVLYTLAGMAERRAPAGSPRARRRALHGMLKALGGPEQPAARRQVARRAAAAHAGARRRAAPDRDHARLLPPPRHRRARAADERRPGAHPRAHRRRRDHRSTNTSASSPASRAARGFEYAGADEARISDEVLDALHAADLEAVVICPSNPYHVIRPILEISGMRELLRKRGAPVIAVTPIVGGKALKGSAGKMMRELGKEPSPRAVAGEYLRLIDGFVIDREDDAARRERALARHPGARGADRHAHGRRPRRARARGARLRARGPRERSRWRVE